MLHSCLQNGNLTRLALSAPRQTGQNVVAQFRRGNRGPRHATQPLVLPRLSAISAPCTSAGRVQKRRGRVKGGGNQHALREANAASRPLATRADAASRRALGRGAERDSV